MTSSIYDTTLCALGEGPLWHPARGQLFWFDILGKRLYTRESGKTSVWQFDEMVSAAGWVDDTRLFIASEVRLFLFDVATGADETVCPLEDDRTDTRTNDGRADPFGGFWIGTMSRDLEPRRGTIYRYYRGDIRPLIPEISIPNGIAFSPDGSLAYFADTRKNTVWKVRLDDEGWPRGDREVFRSDASVNPDGAVVDARGNYWSAEWGSSRIACYDINGTLTETVSFGAPHTSCPAFGGPELTDLFCTTAQELLSKADLADGRPHGATFVAPGVGKGQAEHQVLL